jgi:hypothetical protein
MKCPPVFPKLALLCPLIVLASCSKKTGADASREGPDQAGTAAVHSAETPRSKAADRPAARLGDRAPSVEERVIKTITRDIDQLEIQREKLGLEEHEKRLALNQLRGVPGDTAIDITHPGVARGSLIEGEEEAFDAYLMLALQLQTLEAKEELFNQQLQRVRAARNQNRGDGAGNQK